MKVGDRIKFKDGYGGHAEEAEKTVIWVCPDGQVVYQAKTKEGFYYANSVPVSVVELVPPPKVKHKVWVNLYRDGIRGSFFTGAVYSAYLMAKEEMTYHGTTYLGTIPFEWEE